MYTQNELYMTYVEYHRETDERFIRTHYTESKQMLNFRRSLQLLKLPRKRLCE